MHRVGLKSSYTPLYSPVSENMQQIKQTAEYTIYQKKSGRYAVQGPGKGKPWLQRRGEDPASWPAEQLITQPTPKTPAAPEGEAAATDEPAAS